MFIGLCCGTFEGTAKNPPNGSKSFETASRIRIAEVGIPANAFEVRAVGPFDDLVSQSNINQKSEAGDIAGSQTNLAPAAVQYLTDSYNSPLVGGVRIRRPDGAGCTYGFSVRRAGRLGFVTNSHCTQQKFAPDGISLKQGGSVIGSEAADPLPFLCSSSSVPWCRFSDSAFIATNGTRPVLGRIANVGPAYQDKSYDISLLVHGTLWYTRQYEEYWAASAFTGYNRLIILNTCTRLSTFGSTVAIDCGAVAGYPAGYGAAIGGDSGSPVYARTTRGARLVGQIFGGNPLFDNTWLNNSGGIWKDLGDLEYFLP